MTDRPVDRTDAPAASDAPPEDLVVLDGELTIYRAAELHALLRQRVAAGARRIDLAGVAEIDSSGFQLLAAARRSAAATGRPLVLERPSAAVVDLLVTFGLPPAWGTAEQLP